MLGSEKSRGYYLEMICADFLAGASLDNGNPNLLLNALSHLLQCLSAEEADAYQARFCESMVRGDSAEGPSSAPR